MISVLPEFSVKQDPKLKQLLEHHIISHLKLFNPSHIASSLIFGHLVFCFMKCALCSHHLMHRVFINWHKKSFRVNMLTFQHILAKPFQICWALCWTKIQTSVLISTAFWNSQLFKSEFACCLTKMTLRMNSVIQFYIIKMSLMNSELPNKRKRKMMPRRQQTPKQLNNWNRKWYRSKSRITNLRTVRIQLFLTQCTWITSANWILTHRAPPPNLQVLCPRDLILSKVHNMMLNQSTKTETTTKRKTVAASQWANNQLSSTTLRWIWLTYLRVNSHNLKSTWVPTTEKINSEKASKLLSKIGTSPTKRMENSNSLKWLVTFNSKMVKLLNPSLTSVPHILLSRTCRHDQLKYY